MAEIIAFDLAKRTGWCHVGDGTMVSSYFDMREVKKEGWAQQLVWATSAIQSVLNRYNAALGHGLAVVVERPHGGFKNQDAARVLLSLLQILKEESPVKLNEVNPSTLKKWATGNGRAEKKDMIRSVYQRTMLEIKDHNEADAILLALYGREVLGL